jgi:monoterpene epsilon-lactone hydrolase
MWARPLSQGISLIMPKPKRIFSRVSAAQNAGSGHSAHVIHQVDRGDEAITAAMRDVLRPAKGKSQGPEARGQFDAFMESVPPRNDVTFERDSVGGIPGIWAHPASKRSGDAIVHLHGGWFNFGSATAYRHLVGHIAARAGAKAFVPDYRLAPEHPFPAATDDALACYLALAASGAYRIVLTGDSAGGNLALVLASRIAESAASSDSPLVGVAVFSPVTDLTLSGASYETRAEADPFFTRAQVAELVQSYLGGTDSKSPLASPLFGGLAGMPPVRVHVGDDEVLLDDSLRYVEHAVAEGVDAQVDVWMGMAHGFVASIGKLKAAASSLDAVGAFLGERLQRPSGS